MGALDPDQTQRLSTGQILKWLVDWLWRLASIAAQSRGGCDLKPNHLVRKNSRSAQIIQVVNVRRNHLTTRMGISEGQSQDH
jgi:hypothetical protein